MIAEDGRANGGVEGAGWGGEDSLALDVDVMTWDWPWATTRTLFASCAVLIGAGALYPLRLRER